MSSWEGERSAMRRLRLLLLGVFLWTLPAATASDDSAPNTLTTAEEADGCILLFDGQTSSRCQIEGPYKIENGTLVIGGPAPSRLRLLGNFYDDFEIQFDYQGWAGVNCHNVPFWGANGEGYQYGLHETKPGRWHRAHHQVRYGTRTGSVICNCQDLTAEAPLDTSGPNTTGNGIFARGYIDRFELEVPAGGTLILRNVKLKANQSFWLIFWVVAVSLTLVLGAGALLVVRRLRRKPVAAPAELVHGAP
jgi:hypothetical protein